MGRRRAGVEQDLEQLKCDEGTAAPRGGDVPRAESGERSIAGAVVVEGVGEVAGAHAESSPVREREQVEAAPPPGGRDVVVRQVRIAGPQDDVFATLPLLGGSTRHHGHRGADAKHHERKRLPTKRIHGLPLL